MPEGMQGHALELGAYDDALEGAAQIDEWGPLRAREDNLTLAVTWKGCQKLGRRLAQRTDTMPFLRVGESKLPRIEVNLGPGQRHHLAFPASGQGKQPHSTGRQRALAFIFGSRECCTQPPILIHRQKAVTAPVGWSLDAMDGVVLAKPFLNGIAKYSTQQASRPGRSARTAEDISPFSFDLLRRLARLHSMKEPANINRLHLGN